MNKTSLLLSAGLIALSASAAPGIITETPSGTYNPEVYGTSDKTFLLSNGVLGSFTNNDGYCSQMVIDGEDVYIRNIVREYPRINSWVKGHFTSTDVVEFEFPQPVAINSLTGDTVYVSMLTPETDGLSVTLRPDVAQPNLVLNYDGTTFTQLIDHKNEGDLATYDGTIGLINKSGGFLGYSERGVSYTIWNKTPEAPAADLEIVDYNATFVDEWQDSHKRVLKMAVDGSTAWIAGLSEDLPDAWVKGSISDDGAITLDSRQYLGIAKDYFIFFFGADAKGVNDYEWTDNTVLRPIEGGYRADNAMIINLGESRLWFGKGIANLTMKLPLTTDPVPANPSFGVPEWDDDEGYGAVDFFIPTEDISGNPLDTKNLYVRVFYDNELAVLGFDANGDPITEYLYGQDYDFLYFGYGWYVSMYFEEPNSIGIQSVYYANGKEYCSDIVTYELTTSGLDKIAAEATDVVRVEYFNLNGVSISRPEGLCIRKTTYSDGRISVDKIIR